MAGTLFLVATPIGNLADITYRAVQTLRDVDLIACEDTRHTRKLLQHYGINTKTLSYHDHNEAGRSRELIDRLQRGENIAVVSDAGTPGINDPGFRVVQAAIENAVQVVSIPGPSAVVTALVATGLPTDAFYFGGFLPARQNARRARLHELKAVDSTLIFYETPHRLREALVDAYEVLGERQAVVARELTKLHEEFRRGLLSELRDYYSDTEVRGEIVFLIDPTVIAGATQSEQSVSQLVDQYENEGLDHKVALKKAARELNLPRAEAYRRLLAERRVSDKL